MAVSLRDLTVSDLKSITQVHAAAFPDSALTQLGPEAIRRYYEWQLVGPHDAITIAAFDSEKLVGFCFGGVFRGALGGFLEQNRSFLVMKVITHPWLLLNPLVRGRAQLALQSLFRKIISQKKTFPNVNQTSYMLATPSFGILSIAVAPEALGQGAADLMMMYVEAVAVERGFSRMNLTVHPSNSRAIRFYEKMGWSRDPNTEEWAGHMTKRIGIPSKSDDVKENSI